MNVPLKDGEFEAKAAASARSIPYKHLRDRVSTELRRFFDYNDSVGVSRATVFRRVLIVSVRS